MISILLSLAPQTVHGHHDHAAPSAAPCRAGGAAGACCAEQASAAGGCLKSAGEGCRRATSKIWVLLQAETIVALI